VGESEHYNGYRPAADGRRRSDLHHHLSDEVIEDVLLKLAALLQVPG
jgi:hypothetical protein